MKTNTPLFNSDPGEGNGPETVQPPTPAAAPPGDLPKAAALVLSGTVSERETNLAAALAAERAQHSATAAEKKAREITIAELEDKLRLVRGEKPQPAKEKKSLMAAWLAGESE